MRLIDADELTSRLTKKITSGMPTYNAGIIEAEDVIVEMPTIDAVPVVRCKDCEHYSPFSGGGICRIHNRRIVHTVTETDFCSTGERREE